MTTLTWDDLLADHAFLIAGASTPTAASGGAPEPSLAVSGPHERGAR